MPSGNPGGLLRQSKEEASKMNSTRLPLYLFIAVGLSVCLTAAVMSRLCRMNSNDEGK
jgi:hypothetical protein